MGADDGHGSSGGHPLENLTFSIDAEGVVRVGDQPCGNNTGSRASEHAHRQAQAAAEAPTEQDWQVWRDLEANDPYFREIQQEAYESLLLAVDKGVLTRTEADELCQNPRKCAANYVAIRDEMIRRAQDSPRVDAITELEERLREERQQGGSTNRLRDMEIGLAGRYLGGR